MAVVTIIRGGINVRAMLWGGGIFSPAFGLVFVVSGMRKRFLRPIFENIHPKGDGFSDFICTFAMSFIEFSCLFLLQHSDSRIL